MTNNIYNKKKISEILYINKAIFLNKIFNILN